MAQLNLRLDDITRDQVDALSRARGLSTSDLVRKLIGQALGRDDLERPRGDITPPSLSAVDRRLLAMQHEILTALTTADDDEKHGWEAQYHRQMVEVLNSGYTSEYYRTFQMIQPEMTDRECSLVNDILEMFTQFEWSVQHLGDEQRALLGEKAGRALTFGGFDFNDSQEVRLASYAQFLVNDDKWLEMAKYFDSKHERGNSHMPKLAFYQRMLSVFQPMWQKKINAMGAPNNYCFNVKELREAMAAWPHPQG